MVHSAFGSNRPIVLSFLIAPAIALIVAAMYSSNYGEYGLAGPASDILSDALRGFPIWRRSLGMVLILGNAVLLNFISNKHDFATSENYFPALTFLGFVALDFQNIDLHPILFANLFALLALRRLLTVYRANSALSIGFDSGLLLSVAILFFPPAVLLLPLPWLVFIQVRPFNLKEWFSPFTAIITIALYGFAFYFVGGYTLTLNEFLFLSTASPEFSEVQSGVAWILIISVFTILSALGLIGFFSDIAKSTLRKKSTKYIFLWITFLMILEYGYVSILNTDQSSPWLILATPVAVFMGSYFSRKAKRPQITLVLFYLWLTATAGFMIFAN
jgi:hypothetical protein